MNSYLQKESGSGKAPFFTFLGLLMSPTPGRELGRILTEPVASEVPPLILCSPGRSSVEEVQPSVVVGGRGAGKGHGVGGGGRSWRTAKPRPSGLCRHQKGPSSLLSL